MLMDSQLSRQLKTHLQHAAEKLTDSAGDVNEKLSDARVRYERAKEKRRGAAASENKNVEQDDENLDDLSVVDEHLRQPRLHVDA